MSGAYGPERVSMGECDRCGAPHPCPRPRPGTVPEQPMDAYGKCDRCGDPHACPPDDVDQAAG